MLLFRKLRNVRSDTTQRKKFTTASFCLTSREADDAQRWCLLLSSAKIRDIRRFQHEAYKRNFFLSSCIAMLVGLL